MKIFVYGTLKNGNRKKDYVKGKLHSLGGFPGINQIGRASCRERVSSPV